MFTKFIINEMFVERGIVRILQLFYNLLKLHIHQPLKQQGRMTWKSWLILIIKWRLISMIQIICRIIQPIGTLENDEFKIIHGFPARLQMEALISQKFSILIAANRTSVAMPTITASIWTSAGQHFNKSSLLNVKIYPALPSPSRRPSFLQNAVLTTEYPTYANPANIAEHNATLFTVLSPVDVAMLTLVAEYTEYLAATRTTSCWHTSPLIINYYLYFHYKNAAPMSLNLRHYRFVKTLYTATSHNLAD